MFLLQFLNIGKLNVFQKERDNWKYSVSSIVNLVNELCYMLQSGDLDTFSSKRKKKERKKEEEEERTVERHFCLMLSFVLTFCYIVKRKEKGKELFLMSHHYWSGCHLLKFVVF